LTLDTHREMQKSRKIETGREIVCVREYVAHTCIPSPQQTWRARVNFLLTIWQVHSPDASSCEEASSFLHVKISRVVERPFDFC